MVHILVQIGRHLPVLSASWELSYSPAALIGLARTVTVETYQLFHYDFCPYCQRVRQFLAQSGLDLPLRNIHQDADAYRELVQGGGSQQVPCLRIASGDAISWLYESADIIEYLGAKLDSGTEQR